MDKEKRGGKRGMRRAGVMEEEEGGDRTPERRGKRGKQRGTA